MLTPKSKDIKIETEYQYYYGGVEYKGKKYLQDKGDVDDHNGRYVTIGFKKSEVKKGFEGEYLNGKKNGKGKEYYFNGKLKFQGEYLNGKNGMDLDMI